ncbi:MAG: tRNA uridine-5-carboxymethylaminomethyl(34) synthesis enzyme MnmG [Candidatus Coprenecus sp.]|nr:tRNA uridine-5-carboxymethylaminomethyl(34) synthesis enzyme MnmG [Candidatus Coprenecus sp.]
MTERYNVIVIGGGHAGCEAAMAASRMGSSTLLITMDMSKYAQMSCNPSIGGIAKGQIVREIDALGGFSGIITDLSTIQFRMLNKSKGPAMWSPRAQCDRVLYSTYWRKLLENAPNLNLWQDNVADFIFEGDRIVKVITDTGAEFEADCIIITAGTFLNGRIFIGDRSFEGGRISEPSSNSISRIIDERGVTINRMKTGTPPRIDIRSVNLSKLQRQEGDESPGKFSFLNYLSPIQDGIKQMPCYIAHTNLQVHDILKNAFEYSPLFSGKIKGIGPRYCPSIEDKLRTFPDKTEHQLFLEPEGWNTNEYYLQGFSSSLPLETQLTALKHVEGFEDVHVYRPGYAIEYDYFDPRFLDLTLRSKVIQNLFFAGQVNGTTGYEEAAAQGLIAGINAHNYHMGLDKFVLGRDEAYIGVLIDDLVTKGVDEPYRMFTSRAEHRIILRQDNADFRLTAKSYEAGLADKYRYTLVKNKKDSFNLLVDKIRSTVVNEDPNYINPKTIENILTRPEMTYKLVKKYVPCGTLAKVSKLNDMYLPYATGDAIQLFSQFRDKRVDQIVVTKKQFMSELGSVVENEIKYKGYIERERAAAEKAKRLERLVIPDNFDYSKILSLSIESRIKLARYKPRNIAEASKIPGVSPADISVLLIYFGR